jgi:hypothetical protein
LRSIAGPGALMAAACVACCAGPILSVLAAIGLTSAVAAVWMPVFGVIAVFTVVGGWSVHRRSRRSAAGCGAHHSGVVDLPMPTGSARPGADEIV